MAQKQVEVSRGSVAGANLTILIALDLLIVSAINLLSEMAFWQAFLVIMGIRAALWAIKTVRQILCLLIMEYLVDSAAPLGKAMKAMGYPTPSDEDKSLDQYLLAVRQDSTLDPEVRIDATDSAVDTHRSAGFYTIPTRFVMDFYGAKHYATIKRELA